MMNQLEYDIVYKLIIIGNTSVGKSSLLSKFVDNVFSESFLPTIGVDFRIKNMEVEGTKVKLQVWDTAGQERFKSILTSYYKGAHGVIVVFDITDKASFQNVVNWVNESQKCGREDAVKILIGNKCDLQYQRQVSKEQGERLAGSLGMKYMQTSAKDGIHVENCFVDLIKELKVKIKTNIKLPPKTPPVCLMDASTKKLKNSTCC